VLIAEQQQASPVDTDRVALIARAGAYLSAMREQFATNVQRASGRLNGRVEDVLVGPTVARR
jgi:hypothetical protein